MFLPTKKKSQQLSSRIRGWNYYTQPTIKPSPITQSSSSVPVWNWIEDQEVFPMKFLNKTIAIKLLLWWARHKLNIPTLLRRFTRQKSPTELELPVIMWESFIVCSNTRIEIFCTINFHFFCSEFFNLMASYIPSIRF